MLLDTSIFVRISHFLNINRIGEVEVIVLYMEVIGYHDALEFQTVVLHTPPAIHLNLMNNPRGLLVISDSIQPAETTL